MFKFQMLSYYVHDFKPQVFSFVCLYFRVSFSIIYVQKHSNEKKVE